jgi:hypothetical protein
MTNVKKLLWMWTLGLGLILTILGLNACSQSRWFPTDPRLENPSAGSPVVDYTWRAGVVVSVTDTAH